MESLLHSPVEGDSGEGKVAESGIALCLSGGGYRAMLFHVGSLLRLNELGLLTKIKRISSVSGGSITAGVLAMNWGKLNIQNGVATNLDSLLVKPIRRMATKTLDAKAIGWGTLNPFKTIGETLTSYYESELFGSTTLQDIPDEPRFVFNATSVQTGALWRFSKPYIGDYNVGLVKHPKIPLAVAVAASSAFPPVLSPVPLELSSKQYDPDTPAKLTTADFRENVVLTDGGVYDNLGLETAWKRYTDILISDGGRKMKLEAKPDTDWARHSRHLIDLLQHQTSNLRRRQAIESYRSKIKGGAYWGIQGDPNDYETADSLPMDEDVRHAFAETPTRLAYLDDATQQGIVNLGYLLCDAAIRSPQCRFTMPVALNPTRPKFPL